MKEALHSLDGLGFQEILVDVSFTVSERNDQCRRRLSSHLARCVVALHPANTLLALDRFGSPLSALLIGVLLEFEEVPRQTFASTVPRGRRSGVMARLT